MLEFTSKGYFLAVRLQDSQAMRVKHRDVRTSFICAAGWETRRLTDPQTNYPLAILGHSDIWKPLWSSTQRRQANSSVELTRLIQLYLIYLLGVLTLTIARAQFTNAHVKKAIVPEFCEDLKHEAENQEDNLARESATEERPNQLLSCQD